MALFIAKPILWNVEGYMRPSGVKASKKSFPGTHGFGHEEWNASSALAFKEDGASYRAFHTERVGNAPVEDEAGRVVVFMYASHDGVQDLVGVAGSATCLIGHEAEREALALQLKLDRLGNEAWRVPLVKKLNEDRTAFNKVWKKDLAWIPNWKCPADSFLWLDEPARLDPMALRGTRKLLSMFGTHTELDRPQAIRMIDAVPSHARSPVWHRTRAEITADEPETIHQDLTAIRNRRDLSKTTRRQLIDARVGQGKFRRDVSRLWEGMCAVSGCSLTEALRASHIVPWRDCKEGEHLDGQNGLFLTAELDALFDRGLISFGDDGAMVIAARMRQSDRKLFQLPRMLLKQSSMRQRAYLARHRRLWGFHT